MRAYIHACIHALHRDMYIHKTHTHTHMHAYIHPYITYTHACVHAYRARTSFCVTLHADCSRPHPLPPPPPAAAGSWFSARACSRRGRHCGAAARAHSQAGAGVRCVYAACARVAGSAHAHIAPQSRQRRRVCSRPRPQRPPAAHERGVRDTWRSRQGLRGTGP